MTTRLIYGEALKVMQQLIEEGIKVDAVITDIPYGTTKCKWDTVISFVGMWRCLENISKERTPFVLFGSEPFSSSLRLSNIKEYKYDWKWEKTAATGHLNSKKMPMKAYEDIMVFYKKQCVYNPQKTSGHERKVSSAVHKRNSIKTDVYNKHGLTSYDSTERFPRNVIKFKTDKQKVAIHSTQKPVALMEYFVKTYTNEGDIVLDFTCGSGSTGVACKKLNRNFIGIDNGICEKEGQFFNMPWVDVTKSRMENEVVSEESTIN